MATALSSQRSNGDIDWVFVGPDGSIFKSIESADRSFPGHSWKLAGGYCTLLSEFWDGDPVVDPAAEWHIRGVGWGGGPDNPVWAGADGEVFEVTWSAASGFSTPIYPVPAAPTHLQPPGVQGAGPVAAGAGLTATQAQQLADLSGAVARIEAKLGKDLA